MYNCSINFGKCRSFSFISSAPKNLSVIEDINLKTSISVFKKVWIAFLFLQFHQLLPMSLRFFRIKLFCSVEISLGIVFSFIFSGNYLFNKRHRLHNLIFQYALISNGSFRYADLVLWCIDWGPSTQRKCCCTSLLLCYSLFQL